MIKARFFLGLLLIFIVSLSEARLTRRTQLNDKLLGTVKWFNAEKGIGFILRDDGEADVFVHYTSIITTGFRELFEGDRVSFIVTNTPKGPQATEVELVK